MSSKTKTPATEEEARPSLVPKLRFPEFRDSDDWQTKLLGGLCKIRTGKKDANEGASDGQYPFFTCAENHIFSHSYSFDAEAILIAGNANVGQTRYYSGKFEAYQRTYVLMDFSGISVPYLYAVLNAKLRESLLAHVQVSAMSYIKLPMLQEYALAVPPSSAEQQKIAECLSSVDELMAAQARKVDALKTHKNGLMQQLFPREGETQPSVRFPEFQNAGEWREGKLLSLSCEPLSNGVFNDPKKVGSGYKLINVSDMYIETTIDESRLTLLELSPSDFAANQVLTGDIFFTRSSLVKSGIAVSNIYLGSSNDVTYDGHLIRFRPSTSKVVPLFAHYLFKTELIRTQLIARGKTATMTTIGQADVASVTLFYPDPDEQHRIATCLSSLDALITAETQKHEALKTHKKGLMQQLFPSPEEVAG